MQRPLRMKTRKLLFQVLLRFSKLRLSNSQSPKGQFISICMYWDALSLRCIKEVNEFSCVYLRVKLLLVEQKQHISDSTQLNLLVNTISGKELKELYKKTTYAISRISTKEIIKWALTQKTIAFLNNRGFNWRKRFISKTKEGIHGRCLSKTSAAESEKASLSAFFILLDWYFM